MEPKLRMNQTVLVSGLPYLLASPQPGEVIVFKDSEQAILKRIVKVSNDKYLVGGDNPSDSKDFGWVLRAQIIGKVIFSV